MRIFFEKIAEVIDIRKNVYLELKNEEKMYQKETKNNHNDEIKCEQTFNGLLR